MREDVYDVLRNYKLKNENLEKEEIRVMTKFLEDFERNGLNVEDLQKRKLLGEKKKLTADLCLQFNRSILL